MPAEKPYSDEIETRVDIAVINEHLEQQDAAIGRILKLLEGPKFITMDQFNEFKKGILERVGALEEENRWLRRWLIGSVVTVLVAAFSSYLYFHHV